MSHRHSSTDLPLMPRGRSYRRATDRRSRYEDPEPPSRRGAWTLAASVREADADHAPAAALQVRAQPDDLRPVPPAPQRPHPPDRAHSHLPCWPQKASASRPPALSSATACSGRWPPAAASPARAMPCTDRHRSHADDCITRAPLKLAAWKDDSSGRDPRPDALGQVDLHTGAWSAGASPATAQLAAPAGWKPARGGPAGRTPFRR